MDDNHPKSDSLSVKALAQVNSIWAHLQNIHFLIHCSEQRARLERGMQIEDGEMLTQHRVEYCSSKRTNPQSLMPQRLNNSLNLQCIVFFRPKLIILPTAFKFLHPSSPKSPMPLGSAIQGIFTSPEIVLGWVLSS